MTVNKITNPPSQKDVIDKVNEIIDDFTLDELSNVSISSPTAGQNLTYDATSQVWKNTSTSATVAWGGITGTLADQTDLKNALDDKYDASNPNGYTSNVGTVTSVNNINPNIYYYAQIVLLIRRSFVRYGRDGERCRHSGRGTQSR